MGVRGIPSLSRALILNGSTPNLEAISMVRGIPRSHELLFNFLIDMSYLVFTAGAIEAFRFLQTFTRALSSVMRRILLVTICETNMLIKFTSEKPLFCVGIYLTRPLLNSSFKM